MRHLPPMLLMLLLAAAPGHGAEPVRVAVAANFRGTLEQVNALFRARTAYDIVLSSASTGVLFNQITHGAPFDIFFSADRQSAVKLATAGEPGSAQAPFCYAVGSLVLAGGDGSLAALADPTLSLAIANPATAPYGMAAIEVLARAEFSGGADRKLVRGANVAQAYQFWHSGAADLALIPAVLAPAATPVPIQWHRPLEQFAVVLSPLDTHPALAAYLNWVRSDTVRALITDAGYQPCP